MKNNAYRIAWLLILTVGLNFNLNAQINTLNDVRNEITTVSEKEINAFKMGDCQTLGNFIDDNATLFLNGKRAPGKKMLIGFCRNIERPFEKASKVEMEYIPISYNSAYVIRTMEFSKNEKIYKREIVTKIWVRGESGWKIVHLHSTITKV